MTYAERPSDIPADHAHPAIVVFTSVHIPGDERSRTCPGHGYPAEDRNICQYIVFKDDAEMLKWIEGNNGQACFVALRAKKLTVEKKYELIP